MYSQFLPGQTVKFSGPGNSLPNPEKALDLWDVVPPDPLPDQPVPEVLNPKARPAVMNPMDMTQFGQWLTDQQEKRVKALWQKQCQAQENLVKDLCQSLKETQPSVWRHRGRLRSSLLPPKLTPQDDIGAYLYAFKITATMARWPAMQWILGLYLTSPAQVVLKNMPSQEIANYQRVEVVILDHYEVTEKTQRQRFWGLQYKPGDCPRAMRAELKEYATCWLRYQTPGEQAIVKEKVLEQVFLVIPMAIRDWLMRNGLTAFTEAAAELFLS